MASGGMWNRSGRHSGGPRKAHLGVPASRGGTFKEWFEAAAALVRGQTGKELKDTISEEQLLAWYDAGERSSWAASVVIEHIKRNVKSDDPATE